jgi:hypothetical protein
MCPAQLILVNVITPQIMKVASCNFLPLPVTSYTLNQFIHSFR